MSLRTASLTLVAVLAMSAGVRANGPFVPKTGLVTQNESTALLARQHNDANVIAIGARQHTVEEAISFIDTFIAEPFSFEERHVRRIAQLAEFEATGDIAGKGVDR